MKDGDGKWDCHLGTPRWKSVKAHVAEISKPRDRAAKKSDSNIMEMHGKFYTNITSINIDVMTSRFQGIL